VLDTGDASTLSTKLTGRRRAKEIALVAIANYAKFTGRYDKFQELRRRYNLKWSRTDSMQALQRFFSEDNSLERMIELVRDMAQKLPPHMGDIIRFGTITGLRASEVIESARLIKCGLSPQYYNPDGQALEHFRFPDIFLRQTKKAYISFLSTDMYDYFTKNLGKPTTLNSITLACRRRGIKMNMHLTRKIFASWLRKEGIQPEIVDLLQGRVSQSILTRHYLAPSQSMKDDVLQALEKLQQQL
jgi:intergrase/recombinase